jgi:hypothetical protein
LRAISRLAARPEAAASNLSWLMQASPMPFTSRRRVTGAWITSVKEPNFFKSSLASGLVSRRGIAANNAISSNS